MSNVEGPDSTSRRLLQVIGDVVDGATGTEVDDMAYRTRGVNIVEI